MDSITLENYRCFGEKQTARLAPLTLLVGDNSTGKTSFQAMIRALLSAASHLEQPDFKEPPYDLGSFDEIAHRKSGRSPLAETFSGGFNINSPVAIDDDDYVGSYQYNINFGRQGTTPVPIKRRYSSETAWVELLSELTESPMLKVGTSRGNWERPVPGWIFEMTNRGFAFPMNMYILTTLFEERAGADVEEFVPTSGGNPISSEDMTELSKLIRASVGSISLWQLFAGAPVRSKPHRTYDPARPATDPEGDYIPMYLADVYYQDPNKWKGIKQRLEEFGKSSGLYDEIHIRRLGDRESEPFQVQVRKFEGDLKGSRHNLIDMGYGVSQILPVVTELLRERGHSFYSFLLQQPEVHLHPSAQAALGSLFCKVVSEDRHNQIIVETHSDHIIDRVRMDVRDGVSGLSPDDVSILYFERETLSVRIHSLGIDANGNVTGAPDNYRQFFLQEMQKDLGF